MVGARITVLMPVYNAERHLREAIDSILAQSFKPFEFLIIDDGSTDRSASIIASYRDERIRFLRNETNMGISATLNKGIALSSCELIARMDADDVSHPQRLQKQFGFMKRNPECALLSTWARVVNEAGKFVRLERYRSNFYYYNLTFECWIYHPTVMFRKSAVEEVGMYSMPYSEDYDLFWKMSTHFRIANLCEALVDYRLSSTSLNAVLKKEEYEQANERNVLRNIRYYLGRDFSISAEALECLRHNFKPVLSAYSKDVVLESLAVVDAVAERMQHIDNVNRNPKAIAQARHFKRRFILREVSKRLPLSQAMRLLVRTRAWMSLLLLLKNFAKRQLKQRFKIVWHAGNGARFKTFTSGFVKNS